MKFITLIFIFSSCSFGFADVRPCPVSNQEKAFVLPDGEGPGSKMVTKYRLYICGMGFLRDPTPGQVAEMFGSLQAEDRKSADDLANLLTEGETRKSSDFIKDLQSIPDSRVTLSNVLINGAVSEEQTNALNVLAAKFGSSNPKEPETTQLFGFDEFNRMGEINSKIFDDLAESGASCNASSKITDGLRGMSFEFKDNFKSTVIPIKMKKISMETYEITYFEKDFLQEMSPLQTRRIRIPLDKKQTMTWTGLDGATYEIPHQEAMLKSTKEMFGGTWGAAGVPLDPSCTAEKMVEKVYRSGTSPSKTNPTKAVQ